MKNPVDNAIGIFMLVMAIALIIIMTIENKEHHRPFRLITDKQGSEW